MDPRGLKGGRDLFIDIENGVNASGQQASKYDIFCEKHTDNWSGFANIDGSIKGDEAESSSRSFPISVVVPVTNGDPPADRKIGGEENGGLLEEKDGVEKPKKKKNCKKPPKPPRPPKGPILGAADEKLVREISELAMLKRARIERMKALKKMKNTKATSSNSNLWALVITVLFCLVIFWQGFCSRSSSNLAFEGSPVSSVGTRGGFFSVQYYSNASGSNSSSSSSGSPNIVEQVSSLDGQGDASAVAR